VVEIEKGRRLPRPETLNALGDALQLSPADIAYLHGLAGYRPETVMPPLEQIKRVLQTLIPDIAQRLYPVYVMDYQFRFWMMNSAVAAYEGGNEDHLGEMLRYGIDGLRLSFDSRLLSHDGFISPEAIEREALFRFKAMNLYRRHEPFYLAYPERMRPLLTIEDYARFEKRWQEVDVRMQDAYPTKPEIEECIGSTRMIFNVYMMEILHLDRLFFVAYYEPKDDGAGNRERCEAFFICNASKNKKCVCAWDYSLNNGEVSER
jgi:hypothetical protein